MYFNIIFIRIYVNYKSIAEEKLIINLTSEMTFTVIFDPHPVRLNNTFCNLYIIYIYGVRGDLKNSDQYILQSVIIVYGT